MCVLMVKNNIPCSYDPQEDLVEQAKDCTEVLIHYRPEDEEIKHFLQQVQKYAKNGTEISLNVKVDYGEYLSGFKTKRDIKRAMNDISLNEVIKLMALSQRTAESKLEEISSLCSNLGKEFNGR